MKTIQLLLLLSLTIVFLGCKEEPNTEDSIQIENGISTFYLIRHAERDLSNLDDSDPELSQKGLGRAMHWAEIFSDVSFDAIYASDYQSSAMTAAPTSVKKDIDVNYYDPSSIDITQFKTDNLNKNVLIIGQGNTTPEFTNQLIGVDKYYELSESDNGSLFIVQIINGVATSQKININCNCPD